jgi:hypothetical protein
LRKEEKNFSNNKKKVASFWGVIKETESYSGFRGELSAQSDQKFEGERVEVRVD